MSRVLLLDVMGTLVADPFYVEVPAYFGSSLEELLRLKHPRSWLDFEEGRSDEGTFLENFFADRRVFDHAGLKAAMFSSYRFLPGILSLLEELRDRGVAMHLCSNYTAWYRAIEERLALSRYAPWTFVSCEWGIRKPDQSVYRRLIRQLGVDPSTMLFVDDAEANCAAARQAGMNAHRFRSAAALRLDLEERGFL